MTAGEPWESYSRSRLPRGFAHAVGRDAVGRALREAGAMVHSLSFGPPVRPTGAWSATDHRWMVTLDGTALSLVEDGPGLG